MIYILVPSTVHHDLHVFYLYLLPNSKGLGIQNSQMLFSFIYLTNMEHLLVHGAGGTMIMLSLPSRYVES